MKNLVVVISRDSMGGGSEDLGKILAKGFINSLAELEHPPTSMIFFNSGAFLTAESSNVLEDLGKLQARGTEILTCGTCINFYELAENPAAGIASNMPTITKKMATADSVINI